MSYIHSNPIELYEPKWKDGDVGSLKNLEKKLTNYPYSSLMDYSDLSRASAVILDSNEVKVVRKINIPQMIEDSKLYYEHRKTIKASP